MRPPSCGFDRLTRPGTAPVGAPGTTATARTARATRAAGAALAAVALTALAGGCSRPDPSEGFDLPSPSPKAAASSPAYADGPTPARATTGAPGTSGTGAGQAHPARCHTDDLEVTLGAPRDGGITASGAPRRAMTVTFTNRGAAPCTLFGFPGATLASADGDTYDLPRSTTATPATVEVAPGGTAMASVVYRPAPGPAPSAAPTRPTPVPLDGPAGPADEPRPGPPRPFPVRDLLITPPDEVEPVRLAWPDGPVLDGRGAARDDSFVTVVIP